MSLRTYQSTIGEYTVHIKAKKDHSKKIASMIRNVATDLPNHFKEINGIIGGEESTSTLWSPFTLHKIKDPEGWKAEVKELMESLPDPITLDNLPTIQAHCNRIFDKHVPVEDNRRTPEEETERQAETAQVIKDREDKTHARDTALINRWRMPRADKVSVPEGMIPVVAELNYDDSDSMTDYFNRHCPYGPAFLLGFVKKRSPQREDTIRRFVNLYPELKELDWTWHKEDYSMGHGYWLESNCVGEAEGVTSYGGRTDPALWLEVSFGWIKKDVLPFKGYPGKSNPAPPPSNGNGYTLEHDRNWTWITFHDKPAENIRAALKALGGKWSRKRSAWYFRTHITADQLATVFS